MYLSDPGDVKSDRLPALLLQEVSVRMVFREVEALSSAGVPVYVERGRLVGIALLVPVHERAHIAHRHHRCTAPAQAACAPDTLLRPLRDKLAFALERWAGEEAAQAVARRPPAARSPARAALATAGSGPGATPACLRHQVTAGVHALQAARPESRWTAAVLSAALVAATALALADATLARGRFLEILHP